MKNGSPEFYKLLEEMAEIHDRKSHDYATNDDPFANYLFAGKLSRLFDNPDDAGFIGRIGEKLYRLANLENGGKTPKNESVEDTERDLCVIMTLWMAQRRSRRIPYKSGTNEVPPLTQQYAPRFEQIKKQISQNKHLWSQGECTKCGDQAYRTDPSSYCNERLMKRPVE